MKSAMLGLIVLSIVPANVALASKSKDLSSTIEVYQENELVKPYLDMHR